MSVNTCFERMYGVPAYTLPVNFYYYYTLASFPTSNNYVGLRNVRCNALRLYSVEFSVTQVCIVVEF